MLLRKWTTDTPTPHVMRLEVRRFANEITLSVDGVVVHCRVAPFGISVPSRHDLLIDGESWTVLIGMGFGGHGCQLVRTQDAHQAVKRWRRTHSFALICFSLLLIVLARSDAPQVIGSRLALDEWFGILVSHAVFAIGLFGVALNALRWYRAGRRTQESSTSSASLQAPDADSTARSVFRCLALLAISVTLSICAFNAKSIALYFVGNREMVPVLTAVLAGLAAVVLGVAITIALNPLSKAERRDTNSGRAGLLRRESTLGARPHPGSFFRPFLEDIRRTARRWKLGLPRFWIGRARLPR